MGAANPVLAPDFLHACVNLLTGFGQRSDHYICVKKGGTCNFSSCPLFQKIEGTCYGKKAKCCIR
ncbi:beta-defensin 1 isoform X3 [Delphinus delphis]|uniref:beta-defensin 1 isoform X3 n=1 Tax=Delphinus delphis TaxID=9728 RepID=UPI0028C3F56C|nr:beta-defensin 1 isoform X3 [Delphinus delphis]